jgi:ribonuclease BN (tRNA processing enzyme)
MRPIWTLTALFAINTVVPARGAPAQISTLSHPLSWTTLGTQGGPILNAKRSQPANLLVVDGKPWLVDCGDGALERLAAAGYDPLQVNTAFISHLHMDHIGGLQGLIGLRWFGTG